MLLRHNPIHKKIPVLVHGGKPIAESIVILEYIEEVWPQNPLLPKDPCDSAAARAWTKFAEDTSRTFFAFFQTVRDEQERAVKEAKELLGVTEEQGLGEKKFFGGEEIRYTDIVFGWIVGWLRIMEEAVGVKLIEDDRFPHLQAWIENCKAVL